MQRPHFVPDATMGSRKDTAVLLVGTAREYGIAQRAILAAHGGFWITDELAAIVYDEDEQAEVSGNETEAETSTTETSGNRAAKNQPTEKE